MKRFWACWSCVVCCLGAACADAANDPPPVKTPDMNVPWEVLDQRTTAIAKQIMDRPTAQARGPAETFPCTPEQYYWLLDNPDRAVTAWRRLGAKCVSIQRRGPTTFGYADDAGSDVTWEMVHKANGIRIWLAEGKVKPGPLLPIVPVKALIILRATESKTPDGITMIQHHTEAAIHTDSKAAAAATKLMGQSAPRLAEQGLGQLQLFFSALAFYADRHPEKVEMLFKVEKQ